MVSIVFLKKKFEPKSEFKDSMFSLRHTDIHNPISSSSKQISPLATNLFFLFSNLAHKTTAKSLDMTLPANFKFKSTEDPKIIEQLYTLCGTEWGGKLTPEQFGSAQAKEISNMLTKVVGFCRTTSKMQHWNNCCHHISKVLQSLLQASRQI